MAHEFKHLRRVEFAETDMAGIVHFSNFFRFMEATEHAFFRSLGLSLHAQDDGHMSGWVRVHASCDYLRPARYQDLVEIHLSVREKKSNSLSYSFVFRRIDEDDESADESEIARGELRVVHVSKGPNDAQIQAVDMPSDVARSVDVTPTAN